MAKNRSDPGSAPRDPRNGASKLNTPPSAPSIQYPPVAGSPAMPTTGLLSGVPPIDPWNTASPKANMPPSDPAFQYPPPSGVGVSATTGRLNRVSPLEPWKVASPKVNTPPSAVTSQYPWPSGVEAIPTTGAAGVTPSPGSDP